MLVAKKRTNKGTRRPKATSSTVISSDVPQFSLRSHTAGRPAQLEQLQVATEHATDTHHHHGHAPISLAESSSSLHAAPDHPADNPSDSGDVPSYGSTAAYETESGPKTRENVTHINEFRAEEDCLLQELLGIHHDARVLSACACGSMTGTGDSNGIHATSVSFCGCRAPDASVALPEFRQLLRAGIFPGSVKDPKTGYTLTLLESFRQHRNQDKGSLYDFVLVLQRLADPIFAGTVPDIRNHLGNIVRIHQLLDIQLRRGYAHGQDDVLPDEKDRPYPNRPKGYLGMVCAACPERGVNMPADISAPEYLRHLVSEHYTLDGNFKANQFFKRDNGTDTALTDGAMYFPAQAEYDRVAKMICIAKEDKEPPCRAHIGAIRHQGKLKYGNTAISGVVASACDHAVVGAFVDLVLGESFGFVTLAQYEHMKQRNSPAHEILDPSMVWSYDSFCAFCKNQLLRAGYYFPDEDWFYKRLRICEGQTEWQPVYFGCRAHFHGESAERNWSFLNALGASTRQMNGGARHDTINFVMDGWNTSNVLRQANLLAGERQEALDLFDQHLAVVQFLSRKHAAKVGEWSKMSRLCEEDEAGVLHSVYQHRQSKLPTIEDVLDTIMEAEREKGKHHDEDGPPMGMWIRAGMKIQRDQYLVVALLKSQKEHPLVETSTAITRLRETLNRNLADFRERQRTLLPRLKLSALDDDEPEITALQLPSYLVKRGRLDATAESQELRELEVKLRCGQANEAILAVRAASLALSAVHRTQSLDYRGQAGMTRHSRAVQKANLVKFLEITMYNVAREALIILGHVEDGPDATYPPLSNRDTRRKETHLHRPIGDSRKFDGTAWYLDNGLSLPASALSVSSRKDATEGSDSDDSPQVMLAGTQTLKRAGFTKSSRPAKRAKETEPAPVEESGDSDSDTGGRADGTSAKSAPKKAAQGKKKKTKSDGWIWLETMIGREARTSEKMEEYKRESDRVQWFRAEAEMYRWREQYERKHAEMMRVMTRFQRDAEVWEKRADHLQETTGHMGAVTYAREQAAMFKRLALNAEASFENPKTAAHGDWVAAKTFDELVRRIDHSRDVDFAWMDAMGIHRAYKDFKQPKPI
ncbi:hypothetical protein B0H12DRAFT_1239240 [Mycena haematopus]|nr:hypothetical protein B0H12DRAFT_1239240 [Mycena haematopus]